MSNKQPHSVHVKKAFNAISTNGDRIISICKTDYLDANPSKVMFGPGLGRGKGGNVLGCVRTPLKVLEIEKYVKTPRTVFVPNTGMQARSGISVPYHIGRNRHQTPYIMYTYLVALTFYMIAALVLESVTPQDWGVFSIVAGILSVIGTLATKEYRNRNKEVIEDALSIQNDMKYQNGNIAIRVFSPHRKYREQSTYTFISNKEIPWKW